METLQAGFNWVDSSNGVLSGIVAIGIIAGWVWSWRLGLAKLRGVHKLPIVRATVGTTWKIAAVAIFAIALDRWIAREAAIGRHDPVAENPQSAAKGDDGDKAVKESPNVARDDAVDPAAHYVAKPIIVSGKASHNNQSFSQFKPAEIEGYVRCKTCNQLGSFVQVGRRWQFIEAELAPEPIFMK